jgi:hypothetical protein
VINFSSIISQAMLRGDVENSKRIKPKKGGVAGRKLGIQAMSDSEEDYKPVKAKAALKARAPAKPKAAAKDNQAKIDEVFKPAAAVKRSR